jgi:Domain of unknown function (DUF4386)
MDARHVSWHSFDEPRNVARIAGVLYVLVMIAPVSMAVRQGILVPDDILATSQNLRSHETAFRLSVLIDLLGIISYVGVTGLLYFLLRPAGRALAFTAALFSLAGCIISLVGLLTLVAPVAALGAAHPRQAISADIVLLPLQWRYFFFQTAMTMFGVYCVLTGLLIFRSDFMPRLIGPLMALSGASYLAYCCIALVAPLTADRLFPTILLPGIIGEGALTIWLLWRGVDADRWRQQALAR